MGNGIETLQDSSINVADGNFHVVRVIRTKAHVQLQIDSENVAEVKSESKQFGSQFSSSNFSHMLIFNIPMHTA